MNKRAFLAWGLVALGAIAWWTFYFSQPTEDGTPRSIQRSWRNMKRTVKSAW